MNILLNCYYLKWKIFLIKKGDLLEYYSCCWSHSINYTVNRKTFLTNFDFSCCTDYLLAYKDLVKKFFLFRLLYFIFYSSFASRKAILYFSVDLLFQNNVIFNYGCTRVQVPVLESLEILFTIMFKCIWSTLKSVLSIVLLILRQERY